MTEPIAALLDRIVILEELVRNSDRRIHNAPLYAGKAKFTTIAAGEITVTKPHIQLLAETGTTDNLDTLNGGQDGKFVILSTGDPAHNITVRDMDVAGGNIDLHGTDYHLDHANASLYLYYVESSSTWHLVGIPRLEELRNMDIEAAVEDDILVKKGDGEWGAVAPSGIVTTPGPHASSHQHGGLDEVATSTPTANGIVKALGTGKIDNDWLDDELEAIAGLTSAADSVPYFTGAGTAALATFTAFARTLIDDNDAATARATLGVADENIQDLIGAMLLDTTSIDLTYNDGTGQISAAIIDEYVQDLIGVSITGGTQSGIAVTYTDASGVYNFVLDAELLAIAGLTSAADRLPYFTGSGTAALAVFTAFARTLIDDADAATARTTLGLVIGTDVQAQDAELQAIAGLTSAADRLPYFTGSGTAALATFTAFARTLVDDADATAARSTLGLVIGTNVQAQDAELQAIAGLTSAADRLPYFTGSGTAALAAFSAFIRTLVDDADAATARGTLGLGTAAVVNDADLVHIAGTETVTGAKTFSAALEVSQGSSFSLSDPDIAHGMTAIVPTNVYGQLSPISGTVGGTQIIALTDADGIPFTVRAVSGAASPTTTMIRLTGSKKSGTGNAAIAAAETLFVLENLTTRLLTVLGDGKTRLGGSTSSPDVLLHLQNQAARTEIKAQQFDATNDLSRLIFSDDTDAIIFSFETGKGAFRHTFADAFVPADNYTALYNAINQPLYLGTNDIVRMAITGAGNVGIGLTSPQSILHAHDGTGGFMFVTKTGTFSSAVTIIPNATGDVVRAAVFHGIAYNTVPQSMTYDQFVGIGGNILISADGGVNQIRFNINAGGDVTVIRTAGAATWTISLTITWI